jgi:hypothetical protein
MEVSETEEKIPIAPTRNVNRIKGQMYMFGDERRIWNGKRWHCEHNLYRDRCIKCGGSSICEHEKRRYDCVKCGGSGICEHEKRRSQCVECDGTNICEHKKSRFQCIECDGSSMCEHKTQRAHCILCNGTSICRHKIRRAVCIECGGTDICEHEIPRYRCVECEGPGICEHKIPRANCNSCDQIKNPQHWCKTCLSVDVRKSNYRPYCHTCYCRLFSVDKIPKRYRMKEHHWRDALRAVPSLKNVSMVFDKRVNGGCSRRRPDLRIECFTHTLIGENDENRHDRTQCEHKRMMQLFQDLGNRPLVMIRFNPDSYTQNNEKFKGCFIPSENGLVVNKKEWARRMAILIPIIEKYVSEIPKQEITVVYLFYSDK